MYTSFPSLLRRARSGDPEAVRQVIAVLEPTLRKNARMVRTDDAYSDLVVWLLEALGKYRGPLRTETGGNSPGTVPQQENPIHLT